MDDIPFARSVNGSFEDDIPNPPYGVAKAIVARLGGVSAVTRAIGYKYPSTVGQWVRRGVIPFEQWPNVLKAAQDIGVPLSVLDFIPAPWRELETDPSYKQSEADL